MNIIIIVIVIGGAVAFALDQVRRRWGDGFDLAALVRSCSCCASDAKSH